MLMVNSGWLGPTTTSPTTEGRPTRNRTSDRTILSCRRSVFENDRVIRATTSKTSRARVQDRRTLWSPCVPSPGTVALRYARCQPGFHCFQPVSVAAKSAGETSAGIRVTLMIHVAVFTRIDGGSDPSGSVTGQKEPNLVVRSIPIREKPDFPRTQVVNLYAYALIHTDRGKSRSRHYGSERCCSQQ